MKNTGIFIFYIALIVFTTNNAFAMKGFAGKEAVLLDGSLNPDITLEVEETVNLEKGRANPAVRMRLNNIAELFNGKQTHLGFQFFEIDDTGVRNWQQNKSVKITNKNLKNKNSKIFKVRFNTFLQEERVFEVRLFDDKGNKVNTYKFSLKLNDFTPVTDIGDLPIDDENLAALQEFVYQNLFIRQNNASITRGTGDTYFLNLRRTRFTKDAIGENTVDDINITVPGEDKEVIVGGEAIPGPEGPQGPEGPTGPQGPAGDGFEMVGNAVVIGEPINDLVIGSTQTGDTGNPDNDSRMFFDKANSAFRAGFVDDDQWDTANVGKFSATFGMNSVASGDWAFATGAGSMATGLEAVAMGENAIAAGNQSIAVGNDPQALGQASVSMGNKTITTGLGAVSLGSRTEANNSHAIALGREVIAGGRDSFAFGQHVDATGTSSFVIGVGVDTGNRITNAINDSLMIGFNSTVPTVFVGSSAGAGTTGNVGIGNSDPQRKVHITGAMRLEPQTDAPATAQLGDIYVDDSEAVCVYASGTWTKIAGTGTCI